MACDGDGTLTFAASLTSLPILLYHFGRLSLIAPLANVLMLPAVPYAMVFGSLATVGGMLWTPLGQLLALLAWPFLQWLLLVSRVLAHVPGAYTTLPPFSVWWVWSWYLLISVSYLRFLSAQSVGLLSTASGKHAKVRHPA